MIVYVASGRVCEHYEYDDTQLVAVSQSYRGAWEALYRWYLASYRVEMIYGGEYGPDAGKRIIRSVQRASRFRHADIVDYIIEKVEVLP